MKQIGLECEYFVLDKEDKVVDVRGLGISCDDCGYLAEARGKPSTDMYAAVYSLLGEEKKIADKVAKEGLKLAKVPYMKFNSKPFLRKYGKDVSKERNLYGKADNSSLPRAGLHIHFSNTSSMTVNDNGKEKTITLLNQLDVPSIVRKIDNKFGDCIKGSKRVKGSYEFKEHGFEYRSLPNNLDEAQLLELADFCFNLF